MHMSNGSKRLLVVYTSQWFSNLFMYLFSSPGFVEELVQSGRQIDAVHFAHAFKLTESFPLVPLLKTYLKDLRRNSQGKPGGGGTGAMVGSFLALVTSSLALLFSYYFLFWCESCHVCVV